MNLPFLNPWLLLGLPLAAVPVVIHLLSRRKATKIRWGAMILLRRVMIFHSRQVRLEDLLLMLLRCAAVLLLLLAVARPTTRWLAPGMGSQAGLLIAVDSSLSMAHRPGIRSRLDDALDRVRQILATQQPGQPLTLVAIAGRPRVLLRNAGYDPQQVESILHDWRPFDECLDLENCLADLDPLIREIKAPQHEIYLVTDGQANVWGRISEKARSSLQSLSQAASVRLLPVDCAGEDNLAVDQLELASGMLRTGSLARFHARVHNYSRTALDAGELGLWMNDQLVDKRFVGQLAAEQTADVFFHVPLRQAGVMRLIARSGDDPLMADNSRYAVVNVRSSMRVLCVDGEGAERAEGGGTKFIVTALAPRTAKGAGALPEVDRIPWLLFGRARVSEYDIVILADVPGVPAEMAEPLRKFVEQGGGLMIFAGRNSKCEALNERFAASLLPAALVAAQGDPGRQTGRLLDLDLPNHAAVNPLRLLPRELLSDASFHRYMKVVAAPEGRTLLKLSGGGEPLLLERAVGRGKVLLFTSNADRDWSNLGVNPAFPLLMQQAITYLTRQSFEQPVTTPQPLVLALPGVEAGAEVSLTDPAGKQSALQTMVRHGEVLVEVPEMPLPGFYQLATGPDEAPLVVAANTPSPESDVKVLTSGELAQGVAGLPVRVLSSAENLAAVVVQGRLGHELWFILAAVALAAMVSEGWLARWYSRRNP